MIFFTRSYLVRTDSRLHRYFRALQDRGLEWHAIAWDRTGVEPPAEGVTYYAKPSPIGGGMRNLLRILRWNVFCFRELVRVRRRVSWVHAVDLDGALGAFVFSRLFRKRFIFDAFDKYSDTRNMPKPLGWLSDVLERFCMRHADRVILPDPCRIAQHGIEDFKNILLVENVPGDTPETRRVREAPAFDAHEVIRLAYVGTLEPVHRGIEDLLEVVAGSKGRLSLSIAGTGPLESLCQHMADAHPGIRFHGQVAPDAGIRLMGEADIVVGMYYRSSRNHLFAAPNKYFEHLMLGKALITTEGTPPGDKVAAHATGWALPEGEAALRHLLAKLTFPDVYNCGRRAAALWERQYQAYFDDVLVGRYAELVGGSAR